MIISFLCIGNERIQVQIICYSFLYFYTFSQTISINFFFKFAYVKSGYNRNKKSCLKMLLLGQHKNKTERCALSLVEFKLLWFFFLLNLTMHPKPKSRILPALLLQKTRRTLAYMNRHGSKHNLIKKNQPFFDG